MRIFAKFRASLHWVKAIDLAATHRNEEALIALDKAENCHPPEGIEQTLLRGHILLSLGRYSECINIMEGALDRLGKARSLNNAERMYLSCYANWRAESAEKLSDSETHRFSPNFSSVRLDLVPDHLKRKFPLRDHPLWR